MNKKLNDSPFIEIKILVLGNYQTGKTAYCKRYSKNVFGGGPIESEFSFKLYNKDDKLYRIQLWDIRRSFEYRLTGVISKDASGIIVVSYKPDTIELEEIIKVKDTLDKSVTFIDNKKLPFILVQPFSDLLSQDDSSTKELKQFAEEKGFNGFFSVSSKTGIGVNESMEFLLEIIIERIKKLQNTKVIHLNKYKKVSNRCIE